MHEKQEPFSSATSPLSYPRHTLTAFINVQLAYTIIRLVLLHSGWEEQKKSVAPSLMLFVMGPARGIPLQGPCCYGWFSG